MVDLITISDVTLLLSITGVIVIRNRSYTVVRLI